MVGSIPIFYTITDAVSKLHDSVIGSGTSTLDDFVISLSNRFTSQLSLGHPFVAHVALLVCV
jgi:hypothetical protein